MTEIVIYVEPKLFIFITGKWYIHEPKPKPALIKSRGLSSWLNHYVSININSKINTELSNLTAVKILIFFLAVAFLNFVFSLIYIHIGTILEFSLNAMILKFLSS